ncbi:hypothetical protein CMUS01_12359 [Colletotrichum musicola]|uniref:Uncharacterized protein n=1 Tax=Colletotrichum musicola TaxID=2175873 RepID=A0A8H6JMG9_9PEZI|nr:hypothetical protein CMUS01_12359 [Colletotrichum musicola]
MACDEGCYREILEPNPDIGGLGVLIGFLGTAWLSVLLVVIRYVLAFDPHVDPLHNPGLRLEASWKPNPIDIRITRNFTKLRARLGNQSRWEAAVTKVWRTQFRPWLIIACTLTTITTWPDAYDCSCA